MTSLGTKIKELRILRGMTQIELCEGLVTASRISQIESDRTKPSLELLEAISRRLGVDSSYFSNEVLQKKDQSKTYKKAMKYIENGKFDKAAELFESMIKVPTQQYREDSIYTELGHCYVQLRRYDEAANIYETVLTIAFEKEEIPLVIHTYYQLGNIERKRNHLVAAECYWKSACHLLLEYPDLHMPVSLKIYSNLSRVYLDREKFSQAISTYEHTIKLANDYSSTIDLAKSYHGLSVAQMYLASFKEAITNNNLAIDLYISLKNARAVRQCQLNHAIILRESQKHVEAIDYLSKCLHSKDFAKDPLRLSNLYSERALNYFSIQKYNEVLEDSYESLLLHPSNRKLHRDLHLLRAKSCLALGFVEMTLSEIRKGQTYIDKNDMKHAVAYHEIELVALKRLKHTRQLRESIISFAKTFI